MNDNFGRTINYMRISVTDRCNLKCRYCTPYNVDTLFHEDILRYEEILAICSASVKLGITHFKITGGEPLIRKDCVDFIADLKKMRGVEQVTLTTNGLVLDKYLESLYSLGIDGINISLDTCNCEQYKSITSVDGLETVLNAIKNSIDFGIKTKINCVPLKGYNEDSIYELIELAKIMRVDVRFIELMPMGAGKDHIGLDTSLIKAEILKKHPNAYELKENRGNGPAHYLYIPGYKGCIGFIDSIHNKFCESCNRIRLTANGFLKPCLYYDSDIDLKKLVRNNQYDEVYRAIETTLINKNKEHHFGESLAGKDLKNMSQIGG